MTLSIIAKQLGWYEPELILNPPGAGAKNCINLVREKIGKEIERKLKQSIEIGILVRDPKSNLTQSPLAIICNFFTEPSNEIIFLAHKLAWNFCRSPLLIIITPEWFNVLSCYKMPSSNQENADKFSRKKSLFELNEAHNHPAKIIQFPVNKISPDFRAAEAIKWIELISGRFFLENDSYFPRKQRADVVLLNNLKHVRNLLHNGDISLPYPVIHDLLARLIFVQFLFQRKDLSGKPALNDKVLLKCFKEQGISKKYSSLEEILLSHHDTYEFFKWLNNKFHGDLFPGQGDSKAEREQEWRLEMEQVKQSHLTLLADFISGDLKLEKNQPSFWKLYSFDVIPLEFISSIYEVFVKGSGVGVHYTPSYLVDFMLDNENVLPWNENNWDLKILDPACGSGIFLVKAFQRLIHRWKLSNPDHNEKPTEKINALLNILKNNLIGVDKNENAVRVASFSLYLALCDEIEPRHYWLKWEFPKMRGKQIIARDFFEEKPLIWKEEVFDLVIGNAPWEEGSLADSEFAAIWAKNNEWDIPNNDIGLLFLPKSLQTVKSDGMISMLQSTTALLFNKSSQVFRNKLLMEYKVEEVVNLSSLRKKLFSDAAFPPSIITIRNKKPNDDLIAYICPKSTKTEEDEELIVIEPQDTKYISHQEAVYNPFIWTALMWGNERDYLLLQRLSKENSLYQILNNQDISIKKRMGIQRPSKKNPDKRKKQEKLLGKKIFDKAKFSDNTLMYLDANELPVNDDPWVYERDSVNLEAFQTPQMIMKLGWQIEEKRFRAALVTNETEGVLCSHSYASINISREHLNLLESACLVFNSKLAVYYLFLTSGQFASYITKIEIEKAMSIPLPKKLPRKISNIKNIDDIDKAVYKLFDLKESEKTLINDTVDFILEDFKGNLNSPGRQRTQRLNEPELIAYCEIFRKVFKASFGNNTKVSAYIYQEYEQSKPLPVRMVSIYLDANPDDKTEIVNTDYNLLWKRLNEINNRIIEMNSEERSAIYQRFIKIYDISHNGKGVIVHFIKPDQKRHWLKSLAYSEADLVAAEILEGNPNVNLDNREKKVA